MKDENGKNIADYWPLLSKPTTYNEMLAVCDPINKDICGEELEHYLSVYFDMTPDEWRELSDRLYDIHLIRLNQNLEKVNEIQREFNQAIKERKQGTR